MLPGSPVEHSAQDQCEGSHGCGDETEDASACERCGVPGNYGCQKEVTSYRYVEDRANLAEHKSGSGPPNPVHVAWRVFDFRLQGA